MSNHSRFQYLELCRQFPEYRYLLNYSGKYLIVGLYVILIDVYNMTIHYSYVDVLSIKYKLCKMNNKEEGTLEAIKNMLVSSKHVLEKNIALKNMLMLNVNPEHPINIKKLDYLYSRYVYKHLVAKLQKSDQKMIVELSKYNPYIYVTTDIGSPIELNIELEISEGIINIGVLCEVPEHIRNYFEEQPFISIVKLNSCDIDNIIRQITLIHHSIHAGKNISRPSKSPIDFLGKKYILHRKNGFTQLNP